MESSFSFQSKSLFVAGKRSFDQVVFTINSDVKPLCRTNVFIFLINIWKIKLSQLKKTLSRLALPGWPTCTCLYGKFSSRLGGMSAKLSEISPRQAASLLIWTHYIFIRVSLRKVRSHLGELACLTEPAHLYMNSPLESSWIETYRYGSLPYISFFILLKVLML